MRTPSTGAYVVGLLIAFSYIAGLFVASIVTGQAYWLRKGHCGPDGSRWHRVPRHEAPFSYFFYLTALLASLVLMVWMFIRNVIL